ncbi:MAG: MotA/TolQ/ExbB proton channel family protein [Deltaproteobacteria bacterium]|nr:MAG: MotA/TolQ/ExbB proton channel family protein [Deltaproteobacteria bacterium]
MDIQERLTAFAMLGASWVMWLLVLLSIIGLAIVLERIYFLVSSKDDIGALKKDMRAALAKGDLAAAKKRLGQSKSIEAAIVSAGIADTDGGPAAVADRMEGQSVLAKLSMEKNLAFLGTVGNNAPFVGLLGTVIGVIRAFAALDESGGQASSGVMLEIGEALVATAIGLLVAIPAVVFFNLFQRVIKSRMGRAEALGLDLLAHLKGQNHGASAEAAE